YGIFGEFSTNKFKNDLKHKRGVISMARSGQPNSAGSQFFIMVADSTHLDGQYAAFGQVISGLEEVDRIVSVKRNRADKPDVAETMKSVTVDTFGETYEAPTTI
ncbi:MAG: peptidylprolyl isomerase, partial [Erysipelotrichaceae bacterium]